MTPVLVSLFLEDLELFLQDSINSGLLIADLVLIILLFADDYERLCLNCNLHDVEDVCHFVCICPKYRTIRLKYINRYYYVRPSVYTFYDLLSSNDKKDLYNLACYALSTRNNSDFITIH